MPQQQACVPQNETIWYFHTIILGTSYYERDGIILSQMLQFRLYLINDFSFCIISQENSFLIARKSKNIFPLWLFAECVLISDYKQT